MIYISFDSKYDAELEYVSILALLKCYIRALYIFKWRMHAISLTVHHPPGMIPINIREKDSEEAGDCQLTRCTHSMS